MFDMTCGHHARKLADTSTPFPPRLLVPFHSSPVTLNNCIINTCLKENYIDHARPCVLGFLSLGILPEFVTGIQLPQHFAPLSGYVCRCPNGPRLRSRSQGHCMAQMAFGRFTYRVCISVSISNTVMLPSIYVMGRTGQMRHHSEVVILLLFRNSTKPRQREQEIEEFR